MMRRVGFRRVLPLLFTLVHVSLLVYTHHQQPYRSSGSAAINYRLVVYQEDLSANPWVPIEPKPLTAAMKVSLLLNLPSLFLALPFAAILHHETDTGMLYAALPFIPIIWYGIGRWIDGMVGLIRKRWLLPRSLSGFMVLLAIGLLAVSLLTVIPSNHHRRPDTYWAGTALILWAGLFLAMSLSSFYRRPRRLSQTH